MDGGLFLGVCFAHYKIEEVNRKHFYLYTVNRRKKNILYYINSKLTLLKKFSISISNKKDFGSI